MNELRGRVGSMVTGLCVLAGGALACHGDPEVDDVEHTGPLAEADFVEMLVAATCEARAPCCAAHERAYREADCRANYAAVLAATERGTDAVYDPEAAGTCIDQLRR